MRLFHKNSIYIFFFTASSSRFCNFKNFSNSSSVFILNFLMNEIKTSLGSSLWSIIKNLSNSISLIFSFIKESNAIFLNSLGSKFAIFGFNVCKYFSSTSISKFVIIWLFTFLIIVILLSAFKFKKKLKLLSKKFFF